MSYKHETRLHVQSELARRGWSKAAQVIIEFFDALENSDEYKATQARIADLHAQVAAFKKYKMERECFTIDDWRIRAMNLEKSWSDCSRHCAKIQGERDNAHARIAELEAEKADSVLRMSQWATNTMHTCHEKCERPLCVANRKIADLEARCAELKAALNDAIESIEDWAGYASEYFRQKHGLAEEVARLKALAEGGEHG